MSKMAVAYAECGCRIAAVLDSEDLESIAELVRDLDERDEPYTLKVEEHESISAQRCPKHAEGSR